MSLGRPRHLLPPKECERQIVNEGVTMGLKHLDATEAEIMSEYLRILLHMFRYTNRS